MMDEDREDLQIQHNARQRWHVLCNGLHELSHEPHGRIERCDDVGLAQIVCDVAVDSRDGDLKAQRVFSALKPYMPCSTESASAAMGGGPRSHTGIPPAQARVQIWQLRKHRNEGFQQGIDGLLRSNCQAQARERRHDLRKRSQIFGAIAAMSNRAQARAHTRGDRREMPVPSTPERMMLWPVRGYRMGTLGQE